ncbi:MAG: hypothetical protein WBN92_03095 [Terriglobia bacterium]
MRQKLCIYLTLASLMTLTVSWGQGSTGAPPNPNPGTLLPLNPELYGVARWRVGESSEYVLVTHQNLRKEVKRLRYAILSEETRGIAKYYTVESQVTELNVARHSTVNSVVRPFGDLTYLLEGATGNFVMKQDNNPARAIPIPILKERFLLSEAVVRSPKITSVETLGEETLETMTGKLKTTHQKLYFDDGRAAEVWWAGSVGPLGLVRVIAKTFSLDLVSHQSKRSVSAITESPVAVIDN